MWKSCRQNENIRLNPVSILCLAAIISAATVSFHMYADGKEAGSRKRSYEKSEELVADGVVEVMLLGQNVNSYGKNLETPVTFAELLKEVEEIEGLERIRFMTSHPKDLSDDLIEVMKNSKKICPPSASAATVRKQPHFKGNEPSLYQGALSCTG